MASVVVRTGTTKVKTGCLTCRSRRIKCDEQWVSGNCLKCSKSRRKCTGPPSASTVRFVNYATDESNKEVDNLARGTGTILPYTADPLAQSNLFGNCIDPFGVIPSDSQPALDNLFRFHFMRMGPKMRESYVRFVFSNLMLLETLVAFSKVNLRHNLPPEQRMTADIWSHVLRALRKLQKSLSSSTVQSRESMILCAYYLAVLCQAAGDLDSYRIHCTGLKHLISSGLPSELCTNAGFLLVRYGSTEMFGRYLAWVQDTGSRPDFKRCPPPSQTFQISSLLHDDFRELIENGTLTDKGLDFLQNAEGFLGRPYTASLADKMTTLHTLRMVEAGHATPFPAHGLYFQEAPMGQ